MYEVKKIKRVLSYGSKKKKEYGEIGLLPRKFTNSVIKIS